MTRLGVLLRLLAIVVAFGLAGGVTEAEADELWINVGGVSKHFEDNGRNETHPGLGLEYRFRDDLSVMGGFHKNSLLLRTRYVSANYQPLALGPVKIGISAGLMDGYPLKNRGGSFFAVLPMATWEGEHFGLNAGIIPDIPSQHVEGAFVIQLKWRLK